jgi:hypothetical protein
VKPPYDLNDLENKRRPDNKREEKKVKKRQLSNKKADSSLREASKKYNKKGDTKGNIHQ